MRSIQINLNGKIYWRVPSSLTHSPPIPAIGGWSIAYPHALPLTDEPFFTQIQFADGTVLSSSGTIVLVCDDSTSVAEEVPGLVNLLLPYLNALRVVAKQPELPRSIISLTGVEPLQKILRPLPPIHTLNSLVQRRIVESAVSTELLLAASDKVLHDCVPVHGELANDASENAIRSNYRSAIIFAAASIEVCAGSVLDREYESLLRQSLSTAHRRITIEVNRHETVTKDPVYLALRSGAGDGGSQFLTLLHETPLYLLGRSLKHDKPETYRLAHSLYRTRNCLAHTGKTDHQKEGLLDVTSDGAITALEVMNDVLAWFGEAGTTIPRLGFVETNLASDK